MSISSFYYWKPTPRRESRRRTGASVGSDYMPSFPRSESFWRAYGWQTLGALFFGVVGLIGWIFYARDLVVFGSGAFMSYAVLSLGVVCGFGLPIHYWRRYKMIKSFDLPEELPARSETYEAINR